MKKYKQIVNTLTSIAAGITIALNVFYNNIPISHWGVKIFTVIVMSLLTYATVYLLIRLIYTKIIWKRMNKCFSIEGEWYHVHMIDNNKNYMRIGTVAIKQNLYEIDMKGVNYNLRYNADADTISVIEEQRTNWHESSSLDDVGKLMGVYSADRSFGNYSKRQGIHVFELNLSKSFPTEISGSFFDMSPYNRIGVIKLFRSEQQRDEYVKNKCKERMGAPVYEFTSKVNDYVASNQ